jgi:aspartate carbamoyltransferase catalytic subunit
MGKTQSTHGEEKMLKIIKHSIINMCYFEYCTRTVCM